MCPLHQSRGPHRCVRKRLALVLDPSVPAVLLMDGVKQGLNLLVFTRGLPSGAFRVLNEFSIAWHSGRHCP